MELHELEEKKYKDAISEKIYPITCLRLKKDKSCVELCNLYYEESLNENNIELSIALLIEKALNNYTFSNEYKGSLQYVLQAYHLCKDDSAFTILRINALSTIALLYSLLGDLNISRNYYAEALLLLENIENPNHYIKRLLGNNYFNLTSLYIDTAINDTRIGYLDKAKDLFLEINYKIGYARCLNTYSILHPDYKNTELGLQTYLEAEKIFTELNDKRGRGVILCNIGYYYSLNNNFEKGLECLNTAINLLEEVGQKKFIINGYLMRGISFSNNEFYNEAINDFIICDSILKEIESDKDKISLYQEWSYALQKLGKYEESLYMLQNYLNIKNEIDQFDRKSALSEEKIAYELHEKEKEADFLRKKNEEISAYTHQLEITNADLKNFAHIASHDMREPLRMVNLYVQKLERSFSNDVTTAQLEYINFIKLGAKRMYSLIDSVLNLNNIHPIINKDIVNTNEVIQEVITNLTVLIKDKNFQIDIELLPIIKADKDLLFQVFQNLISNAIKYNQSEKIIISISTSTNEKYHEINISDNGIGIKEEYRKKVFEIFQRLEDKNEYEGTGIGLTIVKKIMDALQGNISIESNIPSGTRFILQFPV